jgi:hypothetical protein
MSRDDQKAKMKKYNTLILLLFLFVGIFACNLPGQDNPRINDTPLVENNSSGPPPVSATNTHLILPANITDFGPIAYDVDEKGTARQHRAPYGDVYEINRLERPFTQSGMNYMPDVDIVHFYITLDSIWFYVTIELIGSNPAGGLQANYGVELDLDRDGSGDTLIWATPPFTSQWTTERVAVLTDTNHDVGGTSPIKSDAPLSGNGYDTLIFNSGQGQDPDLAWVRVAPSSPTIIQFAFKRSVAGEKFMWGVWADAGYRDVTKFSYNDRFTESEAGSPQKENLFYPIKQLFAVDNTCRMAQGFKPKGNEPLICPPIVQPAPTKKSNQPNQPPLPGGCPPHPPCAYTWKEATCECLVIIN